MRRLEGKTALITGAGHGQGRSHAVRLAQEGAKIVALDACAPISDKVGYPMATADDLESTTKRVVALGSHALALQADVRDFDAVSHAVRTGIDHFGSIDIVVANAGIVSWALGWKITEDEWDSIVDVNMKGTWHTLKAIAPEMISAGHGGSIIVISSTAGAKGRPLLAHYSASKFGVIGLMQAFAAELAPYSIRVNAIMPTGIGADLQGNDADSFMGTHDEIRPEVFAAHPEITASMSGGNALRDPTLEPSAPYSPVQMVEPIDISNAVLWLASEEARFVTGATIPVDAGSLYAR